MLAFYFSVLAILALLSFVPFLAFLTIPAAYLLTLLIIPTAVYKYFSVETTKAIAAIYALAVFAVVYAPVFGDHLPTVLRLHSLCAEDGGVVISASPDRWHSTIENRSQLKRWTGTYSDSRSTWSEGSKTIWIGRNGNLTKTWSIGNTRYSQKLDAFHVETETIDLGLVTKITTRIVDQAKRSDSSSANRYHGSALVTMINYRSSKSRYSILPLEWKIWMPKNCPDSTTLSKQPGLAPVEIDSWSIWFNYLLEKFSSGPNEWYDA